MITEEQRALALKKLKTSPRWAKHLDNGGIVDRIGDWLLSDDDKKSINAQAEKDIPKLTPDAGAASTPRATTEKEDHVAEINWDAKKAQENRDRLDALEHLAGGGDPAPVPVFDPDAPAPTVDPNSREFDWDAAQKVADKLGAVGQGGLDLLNPVGPITRKTNQLSQYLTDKLTGPAAAPNAPPSAMDRFANWLTKPTDLPASTTGQSIPEEPAATGGGPSGPNDWSETPEEQTPAPGQQAQPGQYVPGGGGAPQDDVQAAYDRSFAAQKAAEDATAHTAVEKAAATTAIQATYLGMQQKAQDDHAEYLRASQARSDALYQQMVNAKIDPQNYMNSKSTFGQCMSSIGLMFGAYGSGLTGGPNLALEQLNRNIDRDIDGQKANLGKLHTLYSANLEAARNDMEARAMTQADLLSMYKGQLDLTAAQFGGQDALNTAAMHKAAIDQQIAGIHTKIADDKLGRQLKMAEISRANMQTALAARNLNAPTPQQAALMQQQIVAQKQEELLKNQQQSVDDAAKFANKANSDISIINPVAWGKSFPWQTSGTARDAAVEDLVDKWAAMIPKRLGKTASAVAAKKAELMSPHVWDARKKIIIGHMAQQAKEWAAENKNNAEAGGKTGSAGLSDLEATEELPGE